MQDEMLCIALAHFKVLSGVVCFIAVYVVNQFAISQPATNNLLCHQAMFVRITANVR